MCFSLNTILLLNDSAGQTTIHHLQLQSYYAVLDASTDLTTQLHPNLPNDTYKEMLRAIRGGDAMLAIGNDSDSTQPEADADGENEDYGECKCIWMLSFGSLIRMYEFVSEVCTSL